MFEFIRKIFTMGKTNKKDKQQSTQTANANTKQAAVNNNQPRKFEIQVFDVEEIIDENTGNVVNKRLKPAPVDPLHPVTTIEASSKEELDQIAQTFAMCGQQIKIIREVTQHTAQQPQQKAQLAPKQIDNAQSQIESQQQIVQQKSTFAKPKMFSSGGIDFKFDGQTMYQKQWIKLSPAEAASIRVISDSTNKIVNMKGKHFEAQKWVAIEESADADIDNNI